MDDTKHPTVTGDEADLEIARLADSLADHGPLLPARPAPLDRKPWATASAAFVLVTIAVVMTAMNVAGIGPFRRGLEPGPTTDAHRQARLELLAAVGYIEEYQQRTGELPDTLAEVDGDFSPGIGFRRLDTNLYVLTVGEPPSQITYDSAVAKDLFFAAELAAGER